MELFLDDFLSFYAALVAAIGEDGWALPVALKLLPLLLLVELPFQLVSAVGVARWHLRRGERARMLPHHPPISCIITCYSEGEDVKKTIRSLLYQEYPGVIEIMPIVDGSVQNAATLAAAESMQAEAAGVPNRVLRPVGKRIRGGRVSSLNTGLALARHDIVMALDGDTSFDNDMAANVTRHFRDPKVVALSGNLRIRNATASVTTRMQTVEYLLGISWGRLGLAELGMINNISGAFGVFRKPFLRLIGGWNNGSAEDLDLSTRIKNYLGRHPDLRIVFDPYAVGHTDCPDTLPVLLQQRLRWDGDLGFIYLRRHWQSFSPRILGWRNFILYVCLGLVFQMTMPFLIVIFHIWLLFAYPLGAVAAILLFVYAVYLVLTAAAYAHYLFFVSRERSQDILRLPWLPLYPLYCFMLRVAIVWFHLQELFFKSHLDSGMAPWWVLRKGAKR